MSVLYKLSLISTCRLMTDRAFVFIFDFNTQGDGVLSYTIPMENTHRQKGQNFGKALPRLWQYHNLMCLLAQRGMMMMMMIIITSGAKSAICVFSFSKADWDTNIGK